MLLQATLNGNFTKAYHPAIPESAEELVRDARACVAAGARAFHLHPRDADGREQLRADVVDNVVVAVKDAWVLLTDAIQRGIDTRIGLEDTLYEPDGSRTTGNAALVRAAVRLGAGRP